MWEIIGLEDKRVVVTEAQRDRLRYIIVRDLIKNGPLETLLSDEMLEDIHSVGLKHIHMDHKLSLIHISEPTRLRRISYAVFCLKKKKKKKIKKKKKKNTNNNIHMT